MFLNIVTLIALVLILTHCLLFFFLLDLLIFALPPLLFEVQFDVLVLHFFFCWFSLSNLSFSLASNLSFSSFIFSFASFCLLTSISFNLFSSSFIFWFSSIIFCFFSCNNCFCCSIFSLLILLAISFFCFFLKFW